jgi:hypothetical protein
MPAAADDSVVVRGCGVVIAISRGARVRDLSNEIGEIVANDGRFGRVFADAVTKLELSYDSEVAELMDLFHVARDSVWYPLHRNFSRRRSNIFEESTWRELSLPPGMRSILGL